MGSASKQLLMLVIASIALTVGSTMIRAGHGLAAAGDAWTPIGEEDGIRIFRRTVAGSDLYEFRGIGTVNASMAKIIAVLSDANKMPRWLDGCIHGELVERNYDVHDLKADFAKHYSVFYAVNKAPWPLHNRDYVIRSNVTVVPATPTTAVGLTIESRSIKHPQRPPVKGLVRLPLMHSKLAMMPIGTGNDKTEVDFSVILDPGGVVPDFIVNIVSHDLPVKTLTAINELILDKEYDRDFERLMQHHYDQLVTAKSKS